MNTQTVLTATRNLATWALIALLWVAAIIAVAGVFGPAPA